MNQDLTKIGLIQRILVYHQASLGDIIVALPTLKLIRKSFPNAKIFLLTTHHSNTKATQAEQVLINTNLIDGYILVPSGKMTIRNKFLLFLKIIRFSSDLLIYLNEPRNLFKIIRDYLFFKILGIENILGLDFNRNNRDYLIFPQNEYEPIYQFLGRKVASLGSINFDDPSNFDLQLNNAEQSVAKEMLAEVNKPIMAFSIGTKLSSNDWGDDHWTKLLSSLSALYPSYTLIGIGSEDEKFRTQTLLKFWGGISLNLCGTLTIRQTASTLKHCAIFIGHDSGPLHLASAVGTPCVGIYSSRNLPGIWFPAGNKSEILYQTIACQGCGLVRCDELKNRCIRSISSQDAIHAVNKIIKGNYA